MRSCRNCAKYDTCAERVRTIIVCVDWQEIKTSQEDIDKIIECNYESFNIFDNNTTSDKLIKLSYVKGFKKAIELIKEGKIKL